jgi:hypothetical protein
MLHLWVASVQIILWLWWNSSFNRPRPIKQLASVSEPFSTPVLASVQLSYQPSNDRPVGIGT